jgi:heme-degrading monooxygenase HmoA
MIARIWRGAVRREDAERYADYMRGTGVKEYAETAGNRAVLMLRRDDDERSEFVMVTLWESRTRCAVLPATTSREPSSTPRTTPS